LNVALARRYASALADVALVEKNADQTKRDFDMFVEAFYGSADLRHFLESPVVGPEAKHRVVEHLARQMNLMPTVRNFIYLIVDHRRTETLREVAQALREELNSRLGIAEAQVTSARPLSTLEKQQLTAALAKRTGKRIEAHFEEDKSLLGGAVVRVGSTVYDGSVRVQLNRLREQLETE
jgi:F-type H+-transporting ATPase subunit delta